MYVPRYTHIEAECSFLSFEELLERLEDLICDVVDRVLKSPAAQLLLEVNPVCKCNLISKLYIEFYILCLVL